MYSSHSARSFDFESLDQLAHPSNQYKLATNKRTNNYKYEKNKRSSSNVLCISQKNLVEVSIWLYRNCVFDQNVFYRVSFFRLQIIFWLVLHVSFHNTRTHRFVLHQFALFLTESFWYTYHQQVSMFYNLIFIVYWLFHESYLLCFFQVREAFINILFHFVNRTLISISLISNSKN